MITPNFTAIAQNATYICVKNWASNIKNQLFNLLIETGGHKNIPRDQRLCPMCKLQFGQNSDIEDEYHFILIFPTYRDLRKKFI